MQRLRKLTVFFILTSLLYPKFRLSVRKLLSESLKALVMKVVQNRQKIQKNRRNPFMKAMKVTKTLKLFVHRNRKSYLLLRKRRL